MDEPARASAGELAALFLRLGLTAFGGPAAHVGMMQDEVVERRGWMTRDQFLDLLGAANLIPGPSSTELAIYIGYRQAGALGLLLAGLCFILPAFLLVLGIAWAYQRFGRLPAVAGVLYGVKPVVIAVVGQAIWNLGRTALKTRLLAAVGIAALVAAALGAPSLAVLLGAGALLAAGRWARERSAAGARPLLALLAVIAGVVASALLLALALPARAAPGTWPLFLAFLRLGSVVYGSGYVLLAFLRADLVVHHAWLRPGQLLDAVAVGQVTPGPVFTTATFIGYVLGGLPGAVGATVGIFLPAFALAGLTGRTLSSLRQSPIAGAFLDGVNAAAVALMAVVGWQLARGAIVDLLTAGLALASAVLLVRFRWNSAWLVLGGGVIGAVAQGLR